jgi:hypothetical protein
VALVYDAEGRLRERHYYRGSGEEPASIGRYSYTAEGLLWTRRTESLDGEVFESRFEYNDAGRITTERTLFQRSDGHYDEGIAVYEYDEAGGRQAIDRDNDGSGTTDVRIETTYNVAGAVETETMVRGGDRTTRYSYDCFGGATAD